MTDFYHIPYNDSFMEIEYQRLVRRNNAIYAMLNLLHEKRLACETSHYYAKKNAPEKVAEIRARHQKIVSELNKLQQECGANKRYM